MLSLFERTGFRAFFVITLASFLVALLATSEAFRTADVRFKSHHRRPVPQVKTSQFPSTDQCADSVCDTTDDATALMCCSIYSTCCDRAASVSCPTTNNECFFFGPFCNGDLSCPVGSKCCQSTANETKPYSCCFAAVSGNATTTTTTKTGGSTATTAATTATTTACVTSNTNICPPPPPPQVDKTTTKAYSCSAPPCKPTPPHNK